MTLDEGHKAESARSEMENLERNFAWAPSPSNLPNKVCYRYLISQYDNLNCSLEMSILAEIKSTFLAFKHDSSIWWEKIIGTIVPIIGTIIKKSFLIFSSRTAQITKKMSENP